MKNSGMLIIMAALVLDTGCIHSYYKYKIRSLDNPSIDVAASDLSKGRIVVEYERRGIYPHGKGFKMDPSNPVLTLLMMPFAFCIELPLHWSAKKCVRYEIDGASSNRAINTKTIRYPLPSADPFMVDEYQSVESRIVLEMRWTEENNSEVCVSIIEEKGAAEAERSYRWWRYKLRIVDGRGCSVVEIPYFDCYDDCQHAFAKKMLTVDGRWLYLFNVSNRAKYLNHFWRDDGNFQDVALVKYDMISGEFSKVIWFEGFDVKVSSEVHIDRKSLRTAWGWLWCEL